LPVPTASEKHALLDVHLASVDRISELENPLTNTMLFDRPLAQGAVVRARE